MVDGAGRPGGTLFQEAVSLLYGASFTMKFMQPSDHPVRAARVRPLEGLYRVRGGRKFRLDARDKLCWTLLIPQPRGVTQRLVEAAVTKLRDKKNPPGLDRLRFEAFDEGLSIQTMHVGPYAEELPTIERLMLFARENGYRITGRHHEVYLGDPRAARPERLKTVLRYAVVPVES